MFFTSDSEEGARISASVRDLVCEECITQSDDFEVGLLFRRAAHKVVHLGINALETLSTS